MVGDSVIVTTMPPAASHPATRTALRKGGTWPWIALIFGILSIPAWVVVVTIGDSERGAAVRSAVPVVTFLSALLFCGGVLGATMLWIRRRKVRSLRQFPWLVYRIRYQQAGRYEYVQLLGGQGEVLSTLILSTWSNQVGKLINAQTQEIWFAGDPQRFGVVSAPGGGDICYAYRSQLPTVSVDAQAAVAVDPEGKPVRCGSLADTAFSSPRKLRRVCGFALDMAVHVVGGVAIALVLSPGFSPVALGAGDFQQIGVNPFVVLCCFAGISFVDRVVIQAVVHTTIGKTVFGLVAIQPDTGTYPTLRRLFATWLFHVYLPLGIFGGTGPDRLGNFFMTAVRWRDTRSGP